MTVTRPDWFEPVMSRLLAGQSLSGELFGDAFRAIKSGLTDEAFAAAFLVALRMKRESAGELAVASSVLRAEMNGIDARGKSVVDTCGTGGDDSGTFNISTTAALVTSAAGLPVVKHGNRAVSSASGSADLLNGLGIPIESGLVWSQSCLDRFGFAFCFAPHVHPGLAAIGPLRRKLGIRTIFNLIGPLSNPAKAPYQLLGVGRNEMLDPMAEAIQQLGIRKAVVVHGRDGLDEITLSAETDVRIVTATNIEKSVWKPESFGLPRYDLHSIRVNGPSESVAVVRSVLNGDETPATSYVLANAAAALWVAGTVPTLTDGVAKARLAIHNGSAKSLVENLAGRETHGA